MKATASTYWVYTQAGYERSKQSIHLTDEDLNDRLPGMPVPMRFREKCPALWVIEGWVEEAK